MLRFIAFISCNLLIQVLSIGQSSLTSSIYPPIGSTAFFYKADTAGISPGASGANVSWNFSGLKVDTSKFTFDFKTASGDPNASTYPLANMIQVNPVAESKLYEQVSASQIVRHGLLLTNGTQTTYTNPHTLFVFPMTYNQVHNDTYAGTVVVPSISNSARSGNFTLKYDAYGTITLPNNITKQVLRLASEDRIYDSSGTGAPFVSVSVTRTNTKEYYWVDANTMEILLRITNVSSTSTSYILGLTSPITVQLTPTKVVLSSQKFTVLESENKILQSKPIAMWYNSDLKCFQSNVELEDLMYVDLNGQMHKSNVNQPLSLASGVYFIKAKYQGKWHQTKIVVL